MVQAYKNSGNMEDNKRQALKWFVIAVVKSINGKWDPKHARQDFLGTVTKNEIAFGVYVMYLRSKDKKQSRTDLDDLSSVGRSDVVQRTGSREKKKMVVEIYWELLKVLVRHENEETKKEVTQLVRDLCSEMYGFRSGEADGDAQKGGTDDDESGGGKETKSKPLMDFTGVDLGRHLVKKATAVTEVGLGD